MLSPIRNHRSDLSPGHPCRGCPVREVAVCGALDNSDLQSFRKLGCGLTVRAGQSLFSEGDPALSVFTVTEGVLKSYKILPDGRRQVTGFHLPGDFVGTSVDQTHAFTVEAVDNSRVCAFPVRRFDDFVEDHPPMERELYIAAARELAEAQLQMVVLGRKTAIERIASFFLGLSERSKSADVIELPMCRSDIADYLGLTKETVSRVLSDLKGSRIVRLQAIDRIEILDRPRLTAIASGG
jgi:CRP/FNR family transcriptional regulator